MVTEILSYSGGLAVARLGIGRAAQVGIRNTIVYPPSLCFFLSLSLSLSLCLSLPVSRCLSLSLSVFLCLSLSLSVSLCLSLCLSLSLSLSLFSLLSLSSLTATVGRRPGLALRQCCQSSFQDFFSSKRTSATVNPPAHRSGRRLGPPGSASARTWSRAGCWFVARRPPDSVLHRDR